MNETENTEKASEKGISAGMEYENQGQDSLINRIMELEKLIEGLEKEKERNSRFRLLII